MARNTQSCPYIKGKGKAKEKIFGCHFIWLKEDLEAGRENIADDGTVTQEGLEKFIQILLSLVNLMVSGPLQAVYFMQLSHKITCPFSKYFQILYIFAQIFKYFPLFQHFFAIFLKNHSPSPYFLE